MFWTTMTCEMVRKELVAYRDGELRERDRTRIAAHLSGCPSCAQEEAQLARVSQLLTNLERISPSPDFAATFWRRLAQESQVEQENRFVRWWREWLADWQLLPALAGAASLLIFLGYVLSVRPTAPTTPPAAPSPENIPTQIVEQPELFTNYRIIVDLDQLAHFDEIAAVESDVEPASEVAQGEDLPPPLLENPSFFVHYPMLQQMEQLQNFEAVLDLPDDEDQQHRG